MRIADIPDIDSLSTSEKIRIVADESGVPVPHSHKEELDRRMRRHKSHPGILLSLDELQARIERRK